MLKATLHKLINLFVKQHTKVKLNTNDQNLSLF